MPSRTSAAPRHSGTARTSAGASMRCSGATNSTYASSSSTIVSAGTSPQEPLDVGGGLDGRRSDCAAGTARPPWRRAALGHARPGRGGRARSSGTVTDVQPGHLREDRIAVERRRCHHDPIPGVRHGVQHLQHHARCTRADHHLLVAHPDAARDQAAQPLRQVLRISVRRVDRLDQRRAHRGQRRKRILVERQRNRVHRARATHATASVAARSSVAVQRSSSLAGRPTAPRAAPRRSRPRARTPPSSRRRPSCTPAVGDRPVEVDRDARSEQVAAFLERVDVTLRRAARAPHASSAETPGSAGW